MKLSSLHSISHKGAQVFVTLSHANTSLLSREVNQLFNYGYVCDIPEDYQPSNHTTVCLPSNLYRLNKVAKALALGDVAHKGRKGARSTREAFAAKFKAISKAIRAQFARESYIPDDTASDDHYRIGLGNRGQTSTDRISDARYMSDVNNDGFMLCPFMIGS